MKLSPEKQLERDHQWRKDYSEMMNKGEWSTHSFDLYCEGREQGLKDNALKIELLEYDNKCHFQYGELLADQLKTVREENEQLREQLVTVYNRLEEIKTAIEKGEYR